MSKTSAPRVDALAAPTLWGRLRHAWHEARTFWLRDPRRRTQLITWLCVLWLAIFANQWLRVDKEIAGARRALGVAAETAWVPPVPILRMASLGNQAFLADLLFIRVAQYFVQHLITDSQLPWIDLYLNAIWGLDAHNASTYRWGAQVIKFGQRIDNAVTARANHFARMGLVAFPADAWLYHEIAFNLRYHYTPVDDAERERVRDLALDYLAQAYAIPGFSFDPNYLVHQYDRAGRGDDSVAAVLATYTQATADQRRDLRSALADREKAGMAALLSWQERLKRRDWPWLPETLARMVGAKWQTAPPLRADELTGWRREPVTSAAIWDALETDEVRALPLWPGDTTASTEQRPPRGEEAR